MVPTCSPPWPPWREKEPRRRTWRRRKNRSWRFLGFCSLVKVVVALLCVRSQGVLVQGANVVDVLFECKPYTGTACRLAFPDDGTRYFHATQLVMDDGTTVALAEDVMENFVVDVLSHLAPALSFVDAQCQGATILGMCAISIFECGQVQDPAGIVEERTVPQLPCVTLCEVMWAYCPLYEYGIGLAAFNGLPLCGQGGFFNKFDSAYPTNPADPDVTKEDWRGTKFQIAAYLGRDLWGSETSFNVTLDGTNFVGECTEPRISDELVELQVASGNCSSVVCDSFPLVQREPGGDRVCADCGVVCPLSPFEAGLESSNSERKILAAIFGTTLPVLAFISVLELRSSPDGSRDPNPFILTSCICGMVVCIVRLGFLFVGVVGCPGDGTFAPSGPTPWWNSTETQQLSCSWFFVETFLVQALMNSMVCFLTELSLKFRTAVTFGGAYRRRSLTLTFVSLIVVLPLTNVAIAKHCDSRMEGLEMFGTQEHSTWTSLKSATQCRPIFRSSAVEYLVLQLPLELATLICIAASTYLSWLCRRIERWQSNQNSEKRLDYNRASITGQLAKQMMVFGALCLSALVIQFFSQGVMHTLLRDFDLSLGEQVLCALVLSAEEGNVCESPNLLKAHAYAMYVAYVCSKEIYPTLFGLSFLTSFLLKTFAGKPTTARRVSRVTPATAQATTPSEPCLTTTLSTPAS